MFARIIDDSLALEILSPWASAEVFGLIDGSRPHLEPWIGYAAQVQRLEIAEKFVAQLVAEHASGAAIHVVMRFRGKAAGIASLDPIKAQVGKAELGFWLGSEFVGNGIATRSCRELTNLGIHRMKLGRISMRCAEANRPSWAVAERLGFTYEGTLRRAGRVGERVDDLRVYSVLSEEWAALSASDSPAPTP